MGIKSTPGQRTIEMVPSWRAVRTWESSDVMRRTPDSKLRYLKQLASGPNHRAGALSENMRARLRVVPERDNAQTVHHHSFGQGGRKFHEHCPSMHKNNWRNYV